MEHGVPLALAAGTVLWPRCQDPCNQSWSLQLQEYGIEPLSTVVGSRIPEIMCA